MQPLLRSKGGIGCRPLFGTKRGENHNQHMQVWPERPAGDGAPQGAETGGFLVFPIGVTPLCGNKQVKRLIGDPDLARNTGR